ncbi:hypothetical protein ACCS53_39075, partial [Rhizobium ruizarguesonis]
QVRVAAQSVPADTNSAPSMVPLDEGELYKLKSEFGKAFGLLKGLFADGVAAPAEEVSVRFGACSASSTVGATVAVGAAE